jgi:REP element-mobilizing transposase RayT
MHGDESGSVDRNHNVPGHRLVDPDMRRASRERDLMDQAPYLLDKVGRTVVLDAIREVCLRRAWSLLAAHVRTNHVHIVVEADAKPEKAMRDFKSYASRRLDKSGADGPDRKRWVRHGSTRWLWNREDVAAAIRYGVEEQGEAMAVWVGEE